MVVPSVGNRVAHKHHGSLLHRIIGACIASIVGPVLGRAQSRQLHLHLHRVVVRHGAYRPLIVPIHCGQHAPLVHGHAVRHEDVVYACLGVVVGPESVERAILLEPSSRLGGGIGEHARRGECGICLAVLIHVEVAGEDVGLVATHLLHLVHHEACALAPCLLPHVVHVEVKHVELPLRALVLESSPCADARQGSIPPHRTHLVGFLRQPEGAALNHTHTTGAVEYRGILALFLAIGTPHTHIVVAGKPLPEVHELAVQHLLHTHHIPLLVVDEVAYMRYPLLPSVALLGIGSSIQADVIVTHGEPRLRTCRPGREQQRKGQ